MMPHQSQLDRSGRHSWKQAHPHVMVHDRTHLLPIRDAETAPVDGCEVSVRMDVLEASVLAQKYVDGLVLPAARELTQKMQPARVERAVSEVGALHVLRQVRVEDEGNEWRFVVVKCNPVTVRQEQ